MGMGELLEWLRGKGVVVSERQVAWAIRGNGKRPPLFDPPPQRNAAAHFVFGLREQYGLLEHFKKEAA